MLLLNSIIDLGGDCYLVLIYRSVIVAAQIENEEI